MARRGRQVADDADFRVPGEAEVGLAESFVLPLRLVSSAGELAFIGMTTVFGTPLEVTLSEIAIETFLPADPSTAERMRLLFSSE